jgi:hypothetical protein
VSTVRDHHAPTHSHGDARHHLGTGAVAPCHEAATIVIFWARAPPRRRPDIAPPWRMSHFHPGALKITVCAITQGRCNEEA